MARDIDKLYVYNHCNSLMPFLHLFVMVSCWMPSSVILEFESISNESNYWKELTVKILKIFGITILILVAIIVLFLVVLKI